MIRILILNGPNLNLLGTREPEVYGSTTLQDIEVMLKRMAEQKHAEISFQQHNSEGALIDALHEARETCDGVLLNAGAYTHTSIALRDAISAIELPVVELHLSNVHAREAFRHHSMIAPVCLGVISGFGAQSYVLAFDGLYAHLTG